MEGLECMDGGKNWNLRLYTRVLLKFVRWGDSGCLGLMRKGRERKRRSGGGRKGQYERILLNIYY